jgi:hypothetical protein
MPLYKFTVHALDVIDDPEGIQLPDDAAALAEGAKIVRELKRDGGEDSRSWALEIKEEARQVAWISFETVE